MRQLTDPTTQTTVLLRADGLHADVSQPQDVAIAEQALREYTGPARGRVYLELRDEVEVVPVAMLGRRCTAASGGYACNLRPGHEGDHLDHQRGCAWAPKRSVQVVPRDIPAACPSSGCALAEGHSGAHTDGCHRWGVDHPTPWAREHDRATWHLPTADPYRMVCGLVIAGAPWVSPCPPHYARCPDCSG